MTDADIYDILLEDNEWRILAALEMPLEKELLIDTCAELKIYFALQEMAMKAAEYCDEGRRFRDKFKI